MNSDLRGDGAGEDVDGDGPLPMRGSLVMTMAMISPSRGEFPRQNSTAGALDWFRQGSASWRRSLVLKACL